MTSFLPEHAQNTWGFGSYPVTQVDHFMIEVPNGIKLAAKVWFPFDTLESSCFAGTKHQLFYKPEETVDTSEDERFSVILEYIPYRKSEWSAERDHQRHPWFASHGYVVMRVDLQGSGDSEGLYFDEYTHQELDDCVGLMAWISKQSWSNKNVGMIGKSWGGFNGLQVAYCQPPELKAVISLYSTDDRYLTDVHYDEGGCVIGDGMLGWDNIMLTWNGRHPDPRNCENWKEMWKERLEKAAGPWSKIWLNHQIRDEYWEHGSINEDYSRVKCPILAIGGWRDAYRDAVFRMVEHMPNVKGIIGPWAHNWPDVCPPGPNMEYLKVCLQWFDHHLKGVENNVMSEPKLRLYQQYAVPPQPFYENRPGKWVSLKTWPSEDVSKEVFYVDTKSKHLIKEETDKLSWVKVPCLMGTGVFQGEWLDFGLPTGHSDQGLANGQSLVFGMENITEDIPIMGRMELSCDVKVNNHKQGLLAVRIVDLHPSGESTLVAYGLLNLTHFQGHTKEKVRDLVPGEVLPVTVNIHSASYVVPVGHSLLLCLSSALWPAAWPSSKVTDIEVGKLALTLPVLRDTTPYDNPLFVSENPTMGPPLPVKVIGSNENRSKLQVEWDISKRKYTRKVFGGHPKKLLESLGVIIGEDQCEVYEIQEGDPLSAKVTIKREYIMEYPTFNTTGLKTKVQTKSEMTADEDQFYLVNTMKTWLNDELFYENEWRDSINRMFV